MRHQNEPAEIFLDLATDLDVMRARQCAERLTADLRFHGRERAMIAIVISEIVRNTVLYAYKGRISLKVIQDGRRRGLLVVVKDDGPGIPDLGLAMQDGYTTSRGLGIGLPSAKRLMDEFDIVSEVGKGTTITMTKWES
ncbi:MAG TPA: anti-sigma regulatory factor [Noviherbaspirillum sp.]